MSAHESCLADFDNELYYCEQQLNSILNSLYSDINLLNSMKIIDLEKNVAKREAHLEKIDKVIEYIHSCANFLRVVKESE